MMSLNSLASENAALDYYTDLLLRGAPPSSNINDKDLNILWLEIRRIFANGLHNNLPLEDSHYLAQLIAGRTGMSQPESDKRLKDVFNQALAAQVKAEHSAKQAADDARKSIAFSSLWMFVALLSGAFAASFAATFGGSQRDQVQHIDNNLT